ncbi:MAG: bacterio-opsin activator, partial [Calditrichaeota bacterium]
MSIILLFSIFIRLVAFAWSCLLLRRARDWRMVFLAAMLALMTTRQTLTLIHYTQNWSQIQFTFIEEIPGLVVSLLALLAVIFLY